MSEKNQLYQHLTTRDPRRSCAASHLGLYSPEGIEIRDHNLAEVIDRLFADENILSLFNSKRSLRNRLFSKLLTYEYTFFQNKSEETVSLTRVPFGIDEFF